MEMKESGENRKEEEKGIGVKRIGRKEEEERIGKEMFKERIIKIRKRIDFSGEGKKRIE